jgi:RNA polymerase sigma factor (TIGR02999 family)
MSPENRDITTLLQNWQKGDRAAESRLFELVLPELRRIAKRCMTHERADHTLEPTELVGEIYEKLVRATDRNIQNRNHFFAIAARCMRWYLIDYARRRRDASDVSFEEMEPILPVSTDVETAILISGLLDELASSRPDWCTVVEMRFFLGFTDEQTAQALNISARTTKRYWHDARRWLFERLGPDEIPVSIL